MAKKNEKPVAVGDRVQVNLHHGKLEQGTVKAIITRTDGLRYQIDLGGDRTHWFMSGRFAKNNAAAQSCDILNPRIFYPNQPQG